MEEKIISSFLHNEKLRFSQIESLLKERSNRLAYHLGNLVKKNMLIKKNGIYELSEEIESSIPHISGKNSALNVVLVAIENNGKIFLVRRGKRPFKDKLALPGGRLLEKESLNEATKRIMKKFGVNAKFRKTNSISFEHVTKKGKKVHSFVLVLVTATTKENIEYFDIEKYKPEIVSSDYQLIKNDLGKKIDIKTFVTKG